MAEAGVGEVWRHILIATGRVLGIYLVVRPPTSYAPSGAPQVEQLMMLELESGKIRRFNTRSVHSGNGWARVTHVRHLNKLSTWKHK